MPGFVGGTLRWQNSMRAYIITDARKVLAATGEQNIRRPVHRWFDRIPHGSKLLQLGFGARLKLVRGKLNEDVAEFCHMLGSGADGAEGRDSSPLRYEGNASGRRPASTLHKIPPGNAHPARLAQVTRCYAMPNGPMSGPRTLTGATASAAATGARRLWFGARERAEPRGTVCLRRHLRERPITITPK